MTSNENIIPGFDDSYDKNLSVTLSTVDAVDHCISVFIKGSLDNYNSVFFQEKLEKIVAAGISKIAIRTVLTCKCEHGVCRHCYGRT